MKNIFLALQVLVFGSLPLLAQPVITCQPRIQIVLFLSNVACLLFAITWQLRSRLAGMRHIGMFFATSFIIGANYSASAQTWVLSQATAPAQNWRQAAFSSDGNKAVAFANNGIITSTNGGRTFSAQTNAPHQSWTCAASSADGVNLVAAGGGLNNVIYRSTNSGATWSPTTTFGREWESIASSADGSILVAGSYGDQVFVSRDSGSTWQSYLAGGYYRAVGCSSLGNVMVAVGGFLENGVYISIDSGATWRTASNAPALFWSSVAISGDGSIMAISDGTSLFTSTNFGTSWNSSNLPITGCGPVALSGDGKFLVMATSGAICTSTDVGLTWKLTSDPYIDNGYSGVCSSYNGSRLAAVGYNIYIANMLQPPQSFSGQITSSGGLQLQFSGTPNYPYTLQTTTDLTPPVNWQSVLTNPADANGNWNFTITNLPNLPAGYYRAVGQ